LSKEEDGDCPDGLCGWSVEIKKKKDKDKEILLEVDTKDE